MKENKYSLKVRVLVFVILIPFTMAGCPFPFLPAPPSVPSPPDSAGEPIPYPPIINILPMHKPASFYITDDYLPSETDTGKTAFILERVDAASNFVITAEEAESGGGGEKGITVRFLIGRTVVSLYFDRNAPFPREFAMNVKGNAAHGVFSDYDTDTETFALTLESGGEEYTFENIGMDKNVPAAYQDNPDFTDGQNDRMRDYVTTLGVWTALARHLEAADASNSFDNVIAITDITNVGKAVTEFFIRVLAGKTAAVEAPEVVAIAGVTAVAAPVTYLQDDPPWGALPDGQRNAPLLRFYYLDESGAEQLVPVIHTGAETSPAQSVYITPNGEGYIHPSKVRLYYQGAKAVDADRDATDIPLADFKIVPYNSRYNLLYRDVTSGKDETGTYIEVQKNDGCLNINRYYGRQTQLVVTVYDGSQPGKTPYPCFYANGTEFTNTTDFVINFFDYVYASEAEEVVIPPHDILKNTQTVTLPSQWFDLSAVWTNSVSAMDSAHAVNGV